MKTIDWHDIEVGERQRGKIAPGPLQSLKDSIYDKGLMHPLVLQGKKLVAGERRLTALKELHGEGKLFSCDGQILLAEMVPYVELSELSPLQLLEAEFDENILREDLTWQERTEALTSIHRLRLSQNPKQTIIDTAKEIASASGGSDVALQREIARSTIVGGMLNDPDVAGARSLNQAYYIASRKIEREFAAEAKEEGKILFTQLIEGDLLEVLPQFKKRQFTCIIADPPYGIGASKRFGKQAGQKHLYEDTPKFARKITLCILTEGYRITTDRAHLYIFCDIDHFVSIREMAIKAGWYPWRTPLIWHKLGGGHAPFAESGFRRVYELVLLLIKGGKPLSKCVDDIFDVSLVKKKDYAAEKPVPLYLELLELSTVPGQAVLDPCCGSGPLFSAAHKLGLKPTGIDNNPVAIGASEERLKNLEEEDEAT